MREFILIVIVCVINLGCKVKYQTEFPAYTDYKVPSPSPAFPGKAFTPIMSGSAKQGTPVCAEWTRSAGPDESLIITGEDFTSYKRTDEGKDSRFTVLGSEGLKDANIQRVEKDKAVITIAKDSSKWGMYLVWPSNKAGYGKPIAVNKTEVWWLGPRRVSKGGSVSVYGRNLAHNNDTLKSHVFIKSPLGAGQWATITNVNPYKVDFIIPDNLGNGDYEVWVHNGHGGQYGWSGPLVLTLQKDREWARQVNVKDFGAKGNGSFDDTEAIMRALQVAKETSGSTVYFPAGNYLISRMLSLSDNTRWKGDGMAQTVIKCNPNFFTKDAMIHSRAKNIVINDLTFDTNGNYQGEGPEYRQEAINMDGSVNLKLNNVKVLSIGYSSLRLNHAKDVIITNSTFVGRKSFLGSCSNLIIDKCTFLLTNDAEMALHSWNGKNISMTNSTCRDYDNKNINNGRGWGKGRFFHSAGNGGSTRHTYLGNNRTYDLGVRPVGTDQNSGEQFLWEGFAAKWSGDVESSTTTETTLHRFTKLGDSLNKIAVITKGKGLGQSRWINSIKGSTIKLNRPWNVPPDKSSTIAIGNFADRIVMYQNVIDGKIEAVNRAEVNASSGIQPYGGVFNFIADRNALTEVRVGIANWSTQHKVGIDPNYFNLFVNNTISNCRYGILNALLDVKRPEIGLMATTYRKNTVNSAMESAIAVWLSSSSSPLMENFMYEHNKFINVPRGFYLRENSNSTITSQTFYKNVFRSNADFPAITLTSGVKLKDNTYHGFSTLYAGKSSGNPIGAPLHVVEMVSTVSKTISNVPFTIWNTGPHKLKLKLRTDAKWLKVSNHAHILPGEKSGNTITLKANSAGLSAGIHRANLLVEAEGETKKFTVLFNVNAADRKLASNP